ncbi:MAG: hypothetical protein H6667_00595 [Ardenticatenaceae bacterium]|nr:hypothetical protein [Ardenticatenaceae bacterium]
MLLPYRIPPVSHIIRLPQQHQHLQDFLDFFQAFGGATAVKGGGDGVQIGRAGQRQ